MSLVLDDTTKTIEIALGGAVAANELEWTGHYADYTASSFTPANSHGVTAGAADVTMVAAPAAATQRLVQNMTVYNSDTAAATVTIKLDDPAVERRLMVVALPVGYSLHFKEDMWQVFNTNGEMLMSGPVGGSGAANQVAYWTAAQTLAGDAGLTYAPATDTITLAGDIIVGDDSVIGLGVAAGRIEFDSQAVDEINFLNCIIGIGTQTPGIAGASVSLHVHSAAATAEAAVKAAATGQYARWIAENDTAGHNLSVIAWGTTMAGNSLGVTRADRAMFYANNMPIAMGTADNFDFTISTNNIVRVTVKSGGDVKIGPTGVPATLLELEEVEALTGALADGYAACLTLDPGYDTGAFAVTRHNYLDVQDVSVADGASVTNAAVFRFNAAIGTHKCLPVAFQTTDSGADTTNWAGGLLININGTLYKIPYIAA